MSSNEGHYSVDNSRNSVSWEVALAGMAATAAAVVLCGYALSFKLEQGNFELAVSQKSAEAKQQKAAESELVQSEPALAEVEDWSPNWSVVGASSEAELTRVTAMLKSSRLAIESALGEFKSSGSVRLLTRVERPGQALSANSFWSGSLRSESGAWVIDLSRRSLESDSDLRFYLAHARIRERESELKCEAIRVGLAHFLRTDDGFDAVSWKLFLREEGVALEKDLDKAKLKSDWRYRDSARGSCWAGVYYLAKVKSLDAEGVLKSSLEQFPSGEVVRREIVRVVDGR